MADSIKNGTDIGIYIGGTKIAGATSSSVSISHSLRDATSKDSSGWSESLEGLREWSMEGEGFFALDAAYGYTELEGVLIARTAVTVRFSTETSSEEYHEGTAFLTELSADAPVEDSTTFSFSLQGTGALNYKALT
jgi:TP901-1 family phage major tail protein